MSGKKIQCIHRGIKVHLGTFTQFKNKEIKNRKGHKNGCKARTGSGEQKSKYLAGGGYTEVGVN